MSNHIPFIGRDVVSTFGCAWRLQCSRPRSLPADVMAQTWYGSVTGNVADGSGAAVPGANVSIRNEATGLELTAVTDETGTYRSAMSRVGPTPSGDVAGIQGIRPDRHTGDGRRYRPNQRTPGGWRTERIRHGHDRGCGAEDRQGGRERRLEAGGCRQPAAQSISQLSVPDESRSRGDAAGFQNAQTDTPGRALSTNINGTNRNNNVTRIDGAASINVWLPHHAGYIAPVETIESVNISTNSFDAAQGMTGGAATAVQTKSGTNTVKGSAFYFRQQDEFNARRGYFDPSKVDASTAILGGTVGGPIRRNKLFYFGSWKETANARGTSARIRSRPRKCAPATSAKCSRSTRVSHLRSRDRYVGRKESHLFPGGGDPE